jgi:hypothetical protein
MLNDVLNSQASRIIAWLSSDENYGEYGLTIFGQMATLVDARPTDESLKEKLIN